MSEEKLILFNLLIHSFIMAFNYSVEPVSHASAIDIF